MPKNHRQTRVDFPKGALFWVTDDGSGLAPAVGNELKERGYRVRIVKSSQVGRMKAPVELSGLVLLAPSSQDVSVQERFLLEAFKLQQLCGPVLCQKSERPCVFITVSRNGGEFGFNGLSDISSCYSGGLAGLAKTASHEWPEVSCKAVDLAVNFLSDEMAADCLVEECCHQGLLEVGITPEGQIVPGLTQAQFNSSEMNSAPLQQNDLLVVTGGGRGVTQSVALQTAKAFGCKLLILGRSPEPIKEPHWLAAVDSEKAIKKAIFGSETGLRPKDVEQRYQSIVKSRELRASLEAFRTAGIDCEYVSVDVRDKIQIARVIKKATKAYGPVKGIIHGAGVLADRFILDKTMDQFEMVYQTKVVSIRNILDAIDLDELRLLALFSSSTGRYGRKGQVDYAVANETLNKLAQYYHTRLPNCRSIAFGWGPWDGGMVDASLKTMFEQEGVGCIPLSVGASYFVEEVCHHRQSAEVVVLAKLSNTMFQNDPLLEISNGGRFLLEHVVSIDSMSVLTDHVINGKAVLPVALVMEWLAHAALSCRPDLMLGRIDQFQVVNGVRLEPGQNLKLSYLSGELNENQNGVVIPVEIRSQIKGKDVLHYRACVHLCHKLSSSPSHLSADPDLYQRSTIEVYRELLFHGEALKGIVKIEGLSSIGISGIVKGAPEPKCWVEKPVRDHWVADPLIIDSAFQMMVLWSQEHWGAPSLPLSFESYEQFAEEFPDSEIEVRAKIIKDHNPLVQSEIEILDKSGHVLARVKGYQGIGGKSLKGTFLENKIDHMPQRNMHVGALK